MGDIVNVDIHFSVKVVLLQNENKEWKPLVHVQLEVPGIWAIVTVTKARNTSLYFMMITS